MSSNADKLEGVLLDIEELVHHTSQTYLTVLLIYPINLIIRLLMAFHTQPRLSIISTTVIMATTDLAHFSVVFASLLFTFAAFGQILFGRDLQHWSSFTRSMHSCSRMLFGDVDR